MAQAMWKERNIFEHPLFTNSLGVNEYNMIKTNIMTELKLSTKDMRKGYRDPMKETEESINFLPVSEKQDWIC